MNNNDILRSLRYTFDLSDNQMIEHFAMGGKEVTREEVSNWLKKDDVPEFKSLHDKQLAHFLNGLIVAKRGKKEGPEPIAEKTLTNNIILRKLKIALNYKDVDILDILQKVDLKFSKHELSAFFRKPGHQHYRECKDQILRNFLLGIKLIHRPKPD